MKKNCAKTAGILNIILQSILVLFVFVYILTLVLGFVEVEIPSFLEIIGYNVSLALLMPLEYIMSVVPVDIELIVYCACVAVVFIFAIMYLVWGIRTVKYSNYADVDFKAKRPRLIKYIVFYTLGLLYLLFNSYILISLAGFFPASVVAIIAIYMPIIPLISIILLCVDAARAKRIH